jgi:hypothetical protein
MTYVTLQYLGVEKTLADWGISTWRREVFNQASDSFGCNMLAATDAAEIFPFGAMITLRIGRAPAGTLGTSGTNATLPISGCTAWTGGTTWFVGYRAQTIRTGSAQMECMECKFAGPWDFFFERLVFQQLWLLWNGVKQIADYRSQVVLGQSVNQISGPGDTVISGLTAANYLTIAQQLKQIAAYTIAQSAYEQSVNGLGWPAGGQFQFDPLTADSNGNYYLLTTPSANCKIPDFVPGYIGAVGDTSLNTTGIMLRAPLDAVNDLTCAECMRRQFRWIGAIGSPVVWFDYTQTPPMLKISTRDQLPAVTLPFVGQTAAIKIQRRDDLIPPAVHFKYRITGSVEGSQYTIVVNDIAATVDGSPSEGIGQYGELTNLGLGAISSDAQTQLPLAARRFGAQVGTFDFEGFSASDSKATIATVAHNMGDPGGGGAALAFWLSCFPELAATSGLGFYNGGNPAVTVKDPSGTIIDPSAYPNIIIDGQIAPWMEGQSIEATVTAHFAYTEQPAAPSGGSLVGFAKSACHEKTVKLKLTNLASGTYHSRPNTTPGEPVPYGLPLYIYNIEKIPQYQGSFTVQEQEMSDVCPIGNVLNLSSGLAEWGTMNACIQSITYEDTGKTTLHFGPAKHLGAADLVERLRVNRGPRWIGLIGGDVMNRSPQAGSTEMGGTMPKQSPSAAPKIPSFQVFPSNMSDLQANPGYAVPPGVTIHGYNQAPSGSFSGLDAGPAVNISKGAGGTTSQYIKISMAELAALTGSSVHFVVMNTCEGGDSTTKRVFLCSDVFH